jgi:hypothetical protein
MTLTATSPEVVDFVEAFKENRNLAHFFKVDVIAETRRTYISIDEIDDGDTPPYVHRGGLFLIDRETGVVYTIRGYGQRGYRLTTMATLAAKYREGSASFRPDQGFHTETRGSRVARW